MLYEYYEESVITESVLFSEKTKSRRRRRLERKPHYKRKEEDLKHIE